MTLVPAWRPRRVPLVPGGLAAFGAEARAVVRRLLAMDDGVLGTMRAVAIDDGIVVLGEERHLPWVPGIVYLGVDPRAPDLLLPTSLEPDVAVELLDGAVRMRLPRSPVAVLPGRGMLVALDDARSLAREALAEFTVGQRPPSGDR